MKNICIAVPLTRNIDQLAADEILSLEQLYKILGKHIIYLIGPASVNWTGYTSHASSFNLKVKVKIFDDCYFGTSENYNKLMLSKKFFGAFSRYRLIMTYHTDAFVFRDELDDWCNLEYDFIGAPWFEGWTGEGSSKIRGVGNGGFAIMKTITFKRVIQKLIIFKKLWLFYHRSFLKKYMSFETFASPVRYFYPITIDVEFFKYLYDPAFKQNCDRYYGDYFPYLFKEFKVAPVSDAIKFSFEANPSLLFEMNNYKLPFGCHAWKKFDENFWDTHIPAEKVLD